MYVAEVIETRLEVREYADVPVDDDRKRRVLEAVRLAPLGENRQAGCRRPR